MGKAHKNVGAVVMIFVLVIGIAECRNLKEDEVVSGVGAVGRNYVVGFGDGRGGFIVSEPASGLGAGVGAIGRNFVVVSEPASGLGFSSAASVGQGISGATAAGGGL
ncbi:hypothetical protein AAHE18_08G192000 [Arachis hypogaea]|uniref:Uncharacterized protein n=1 Tax=Arachis hypogaea TaxID=3818 RepID=A0A445C036_ARAHY|nr:hypothetical protein Ahy_A08g040519 isoform C [Arachis hypogaea]